LPTIRERLRKLQPNEHNRFILTWITWAIYLANFPTNYRTLPSLFSCLFNLNECPFLKVIRSVFKRI
jgi:hypothetical protein